MKKSYLFIFLTFCPFFSYPDESKSPNKPETINDRAFNKLKSLREEFINLTPAEELLVRFMIKRQTEIICFLLSDDLRLAQLANERNLLSKEEQEQIKPLHLLLKNYNEGNCLHSESVIFLLHAIREWESKQDTEATYKVYDLVKDFEKKRSEQEMLFGNLLQIKKARINELHSDLTSTLFDKRMIDIDPKIEILFTKIRQLYNADKIF